MHKIDWHNNGKFPCAKLAFDLNVILRYSATAAYSSQGFPPVWSPSLSQVWIYKLSGAH